MKRRAMLSALIGGGISLTAPLRRTSAAAKTPANIVMFVIDDLDADSVRFMPAVQRNLVRQGTSFTRYFATTPLCAPSRASILRGQYAHNHGVLRNTGSQAGADAFRANGMEAETVATELQTAGYLTALLGKYLNGYPPTKSSVPAPPSGWDTWIAALGHEPYRNYDYALNVNGAAQSFGSTPDDYLTDVLARQALAAIDQASGDQPLFLYIAPMAPHTPAEPAPRHIGMFAGASAPRGPAFDERNVRDKPDWIRTTPRFTAERTTRIDSDYVNRLESLQAVDELVDSVINRIAAQGKVDSTYFFFLSDNGYFLGEHRQPHGKDAPHDAASHVPLIVRGPGIAPNREVGGLALNIDLAPTLLHIAGAAAPAYMDGSSLLPLLRGEGDRWRRTTLLEGFGKESSEALAGEKATPAFQALRGETSLYVEYETGERELYNKADDPFELTNVAETANKELLARYSRRLRALSRCTGAQCRKLESLPLVNEAPAGSKRKRRNSRHGSRQ